MRSCVLPVSAVAGKRVTTIEGLAKRGRLHAVQKAWIDLQVPQCGYCRSGRIMAVVSLLEKTPNPSDRDITVAEPHGRAFRLATPRNRRRFTALYFFAALQLEKTGRLAVLHENERSSREASKC